MMMKNVKLWLPKNIRRVPKITGADNEVGNRIHGPGAGDRSGRDASRRLLREFSGLPLRTRNDSTVSSSYTNNGWGWSAGNVQDWGRQFLPNGGCVYIDLDHLEFCIPEVSSAWDHAACHHAMIRELRVAMDAANEMMPGEDEIEVLLNNSDGLSNSYGTHLSILLTRRAWDNIFERRLHYMMFLAAYQVSSIIFTGQGKVGSENGRKPRDFGLTQRADFFEKLTAQQTTFARPVVNARDETLCGKNWSSQQLSALGEDLARLHVIFYDINLCHTALVLKVGALQIMLAMIEAECTDPALIMDDPVEALQRWNADPALNATARLATGKSITALELQQRFLTAASRFVEAGGCDGIVPDAEKILTLWAQTLRNLETRNWDALVGRLDWVTKRHAIACARGDDPGLAWHSPQAKMLDHLYGSLSPEEGIYWGYEADLPAARIVPNERIEKFRIDPPEDTRAWTRAKLLATVDADEISDVDWHQVKIWDHDSAAWSRLRTLSLGDPTRFTRAETEHLFTGNYNTEEILNELESINEGVAVS